MNAYNIDYNNDHKIHITDNKIEIDENLLNGITAKCTDGIVIYKYNENLTKYVKSITNSLINSSKSQRLHLHLPNPQYLYDLRLQGLIKSLYDQLSISKFDKLTMGFHILPYIPTRIKPFIQSGGSSGSSGYNGSNGSNGVVDISQVIRVMNDDSRPENVMFGGTFDRLHYGHKYTILCSFLMAKSHLYLGISRSQALTSQKINGWMIQPFHERVYGVQKYVTDISESTFTSTTITVVEHYIEPKDLTLDNENLQVVIFPLDEPTSPADIADADFLLVVTEDTMKGGLAANDVRKLRGVPLWPLLQIPLVGFPTISSSTIRTTQPN